MSDELRFRNPDILQELPFRKWMRNNLPHPKEGMVVEDLDVVLRVYGEKFNTDDDGKFMLVELKKYSAYIGHAQWMTYGLINRLLVSSLESYRYQGYYVVQYTVDNWDVSQFWINKERIYLPEFKEFLKFNIPQGVPRFPPRPPKKTF